MSSLRPWGKSLSPPYVPNLRCHLSAPKSTHISQGSSACDAFPVRPIEGKLWVLVSSLPPKKAVGTAPTVRQRRKEAFTAVGTHRSRHPQSTGGRLHGSRAAQASWHLSRRAMRARPVVCAWCPGGMPAGSKGATCLLNLQGLCKTACFML